MSIQLRDICKTSNFILIKDSTNQGGTGMLKSLLNSVCHEVEKILVILYELSSDILMTELSPDIIRKIQLYDLAADPLGWCESSTLTMDTDIVRHIKVSSNTNCAAQRVAVVIDSLSHMIFHRSSAYTCQVLNMLANREHVIGTDVHQVISLVHSDIHSESTLLQLEHTAMSVLTVHPPVTKGFTLSCHLLHKKQSGKIIRTNEEYKFSKAYEIIESQEIKTLGEARTAISSVDPTMNLTFNLNLRDSEKEARSQVNLPYLYDKSRQEAVLKKSVGEGKIFYQPDEADDFDEEDPDDDLDI